MNMTSNKPYLIKAIYEWIVDNELTPYISVDAHQPGVEVPQSYATRDGEIVLNLSPRAIADLVMNKDKVSFSTRFGGIPANICLPVKSIVGIYAQENGQGMIFQVENPINPGPVKSVSSSDKLSKDKTSSDKTKKPSLRIVK
jgi:stringent starvation protein B